VSDWVHLTLVAYCQIAATKRKTNHRANRMRLTARSEGFLAGGWATIGAAALDAAIGAGVVEACLFRLAIGIASLQ
jgi:hypothetical protein